MESKEAERRGLEALGAYRGMAVAGCDPDEMGIGPVFAVPKLLKQHALSVDDIDLWELNEAFAAQASHVAIASASPTTGSTSTAGRFQSDIPTVCRAHV